MQTTELEYLRDAIAERDAENIRLRVLLDYVLNDEPNGVPRASSECRKYIRSQLKL